MTEENRIILEKRQERHEGMIHATMMMAMIGVIVAMVAFARTL